MDTLFTEIEEETALVNAPLAVRMRPRTLDELVGQEDACGPGSWLRLAIERDALSSVVLFGPAGLVRFAARETRDLRLVWRDIGKRPPSYLME